MKTFILIAFVLTSALTSATAAEAGKYWITITGVTHAEKCPYYGKPTNGGKYSDQASKINCDICGGTGIAPAKPKPAIAEPKPAPVAPPAPIAKPPAKPSPKTTDKKKR